MSITSRLILSLLLVTGLFWAAAAYTTRTAFVHEIDEIVSDNLRATTRRMMPLVVHSLQPGEAEDRDDGQMLELSDEMDSLGGETDNFLAFEVRNASGNVILRSADADDFNLPSGLQPGFTTTHDFVAFTEQDHKTGLTLTVVEPGSHRAEAIAEATSTLLLPMLLLIPVIAGAIFLVVRLSLAPLKGLQRQIALRGGHNLTPLEAGRAPHELRPIADAVDRLMLRLRAALDAERVFAANSAHELRTPIAGALAQTQRLREEIGSGPAAARVAEVETTLKRLGDFAGKLLQLSRADAGLGQQAERQNMTPVVQALLQDFSRRQDMPADIRLESALAGDLMLGMDQDAFAIVLRNLLENAVLHGAPGRPVRLVIGPDWTLRVINEGPVVPAAQLAGLKERYQRGQTRAAGSGLGLAIADKILTQSGGSLTLLSPATGQADGFEAIVALP